MKDSPADNTTETHPELVWAAADLGGAATVAEAAASEHARARGLVVEGHNATLGAIPLVPQPVRFSGVASIDDFERRTKALRLAVNEAGYKVHADAAPTRAQYDPPWTPGLLRRNEVMLELAQ